MSTNSIQVKITVDVERFGDTYYPPQFRDESVIEFTMPLCIVEPPRYGATVESLIINALRKARNWTPETTSDDVDTEA